MPESPGMLEHEISQKMRGTPAVMLKASDELDHTKAVLGW